MKKTLTEFVGFIPDKDRKKPWNFFTCMSCENNPVLNDIDELKTHLEEKHGITELAGKKHVIAFLDGAGFWEHLCEVEIGEIKLMQDVGGPTGKDGDLRSENGR